MGLSAARGEGVGAVLICRPPPAPPQRRAGLAGRGWRLGTQASHPERMGADSSSAACTSCFLRSGSEVMESRPLGGGHILAQPHRPSEGTQSSPGGSSGGGQVHSVAWIQGSPVLGAGMEELTQCLELSDSSPSPHRPRRACVTAASVAKLLWPGSTVGAF